MLDTLIDHDWWNTYAFGDFVEERFRETLDGHVSRGYLEAWRNVEQRPGTWTHGCLTRRSTLAISWIRDWLPSRPSDGLRSCIKKARAVRQPKATGVEMYSAVLDDHLASPEAFIAWQRRGRLST